MFGEIPYITSIQNYINPRKVSVKELLEVDLKDVPKYTHKKSLK